MKAHVLMIELKGSDPLIFRRVVVPVNITFITLHDIIQNVTNFKSGYPYPGGYHEFSFDLEKENITISDNDEMLAEYKNYIENKEEFDLRLKNASSKYHDNIQSQIDAVSVEIVKSDNMTIDKYLKKYGSFVYSYDFGDGWEFDVILEKTIDNYYLGYPCLVDGENDAPPEDVGGLYGFDEFKKKINDSNHSEHEFMKEWGESQEFEAYNPREINRRLKLLRVNKTERKLIEELYIQSLADSINS